MAQRDDAIVDGWQEVLAPLAELVDLEATARLHGAMKRQRGVPSAQALLRLAMAWGPGGLSLRRASAWADIAQVAELSDGALMRRLRKAAPWLEALVQAVLASRISLPGGLDQGRLIRVMDGSTFAVVGASRPCWRIHASFDLAAGRFDGLKLTGAQEGEHLDQLAVIPGEIRIGDRGFARAEGLRHMIAGDGDYLIRMGSRSLKLEDADGKALDLMDIFAAAELHGDWDGDVMVVHGRKGRKRWPPLTVRLIVKPLPPAAADAARKRLKRAGQREGFKPSPLAWAAAGYIMLVTSLERSEADADTLFGLYRLRWQIELAFKRLKSLVGARCVPAKDPDLARTWLYAHLLLALLVEDHSADLGESFPSGE